MSIVSFYIDKIEYNDYLMIDYISPKFPKLLIRFVFVIIFRFDIHLIDTCNWAKLVYNEYESDSYFIKLSQHTI